MSLLWKEARVGDNDFGAGPVERSGRSKLNSSSPRFAAQSQQTLFGCGYCVLTAHT